MSVSLIDGHIDDDVQMTDNEIIKACPFCGDEAHLDRHDIFCDCGAKIKIPIYVEAKESIGGLPTYKEARQEMITLWNSRVDEEIINRQKAEIENYSRNNRSLTEAVTEMQKAVKKQSAEIERLKAELKEDSRVMKQALVLVDEIKKEIAVDIETAKAKVIKEFAERLKEIGARNSAGLIVFVESNIDKIVKEMVGDS